MTGAPSQLSDIPSYLLYVLLNPTFNMKAALILYGMIGVILLVLMVIGVLAMMRPSKAETAASRKTPVPDTTPASLAPGETTRPVAATSASGRPRGEARPGRPRATSMSPRRRLIAASLAVVAFLAIWVATGFTTSDPGLCKDCHWDASQHATAPAGTDVHAGVSCISCHEPGGFVGRYLTDVPARLLHFADAQSSTPQQAEYGRVTISACSSCHGAALKGVAVNESRGLKVSHREPLEASATCIDCHALRGGVVGIHNAGMAPCLRCHDAEQASAECATCHDERAASAARARTTSFVAVQIPDVSCGGCHDQEKECDGCHGIRLPHSTEFMAYAHARAGAANFWYSGGTACARCHTPTRRPCQRCHGESLGSAHGAGGAWLASGHMTATPAACDTCHQRFAYSAQRDFCSDLCHTPAAIAGSPR